MGALGPISGCCALAGPPFPPLPYAEAMPSWQCPTQAALGPGVTASVTSAWSWQARHTWCGGILAGPGAGVLGAYEAGDGRGRGRHKGSQFLPRVISYRDASRKRAVEFTLFAPTPAPSQPWGFLPPLVSARIQRSFSLLLHSHIQSTTPRLFTPPLDSVSVCLVSHRKYHRPGA